MASLDPETRPRALHLHVGPLCNNECVFCYDEDREVRFVVNAAMTLDRTREILEAHSGFEQVVLTSGEPTLLETLPELARLAGSFGIDDVVLVTNGRRLADPGVAGALVEAGVSTFVVGIHGPNPEIHDALVGRRGAFEQTVRGLEALCASVRRPRVETSTVLTRKTLPHLRAIHRLVSRVGVTCANFDALVARGRAATAFEAVFPPYDEVARAILELLDGVDARGTKVRLGNVPRCASAPIDPSILAPVSNYAIFEVDDGAPTPLAQTLGRPSTDGRFRILEGRDLDADGRIKRAECAACRYDATCAGVYRRYVEHFGWAGLDPLPEPGALH